MNFGQAGEKKDIVISEFYWKWTFFEETRRRSWQW
jgi:hypothetical protein